MHEPWLLPARNGCYDGDSVSPSGCRDPLHLFMERASYRSARNEKAAKVPGARLHHSYPPRNTRSGLNRQRTSIRSNTRESSAFHIISSSPCLYSTEKQGTAGAHLLSLSHYHPCHCAPYHRSRELLGGHIASRTRTRRVSMTAHDTSQRGSMLIEAVLSTGLIVVAALGLLSFTTRSLKLLQRVGQSLRPSCEQPECLLSDSSSTCSCGERSSSLVIH